MYRKILVGYDDSDQAKDALALGKQLADATGAELVVGGVFQFDPVWGGGRSALPRRGHRFHAQALGGGEAAGAQAEAVPEQLARAWAARPGRGDRRRPDPGRSAHHGRDRAGSRGQRRCRAASWRAVRRGHRAAWLPRSSRAPSIDTITVGVDGLRRIGSRSRSTASQLARTTGAKLKLGLVVETPVAGTGEERSRRVRALKDAVEQGMRDQLAEARRPCPKAIEARPAQQRRSGP